MAIAIIVMNKFDLLMKRRMEVQEGEQFVEALELAEKLLDLQSTSSRCAKK